MPTFRQPTGRHRKPKRNPAPPLAAAALGVAVVAMGGLNVPTAHGEVGAGSSGASPDLAPEALAIGGGSEDALSPEVAGAAARDAAAERVSRDRSDSAAAAAEAAARAAEQAQAEADRRAAEQAALEEAGRLEAETMRWVLPTDDYRLSAFYGQRGRMWSSGRHTGQDFAAPTGTPVVAVHRGEVVFAGWDGAYGRKVAVEHEDGTETWYCHLSAITVAEGEDVETGEQIGRVGSTGNTTGPHLHLEVHVDDNAVDPVDYLEEQGVDV